MIHNNYIIYIDIINQVTYINRSSNIWSITPNIASVFSVSELSDSIENSSVKRCLLLGQHIWAAIPKGKQRARIPQKNIQMIIAVSTFKIWK